MSEAAMAPRRPRLGALARGGLELPRWGPVAVAAAIGAASLAEPSAPGYDPWSWLIWGRELAAGQLSTAEGPAWKPLPALVTAPLNALLGGWAPDAWLALARAGAVLAVLEAYALGRRLVPGQWGAVAGVAAAVAVTLVAGFVEHASVGDAEGLLTALLIVALHAVFDGRLRSAFALGVVAALIRVEVWLFLAVLGFVLLRRDRRARVPVAAAAVLVLGLWFLPEILASEDSWRSAARARVPNPGAPALEAVPALATLELALDLAPAGAVAGLAVAGVATAALGRVRGDLGLLGALLVGGVGLAWVALVAVMSEVGFSGEARYLLPGVVLLSLSGAMAPLAVATAWGARMGRRAKAAPLPVAAAVAAGLLATSIGRVPELALARERSASAAAVTEDLRRAVAKAGGIGRVARCGPPYTRRFGGPVLAWALRVPKHVIDFHPQRPGVAFRPRQLPGEVPSPPRPPGAPTWSVRTAHWEVVGACDPRRGSRAGERRPGHRRQARRLRTAADRVIRVP